MAHQGKGIDGSRYLYIQYEVEQETVYTILLPLYNKINFDPV